MARLVSNDPALDAAVRAILERIAGPARTPANLGPDTPLADGLWLDSIELVEVIVACENEFGIVFDSSNDLRAGAFATLATLTSLVQSKLAALRRDP